VTTPCDTSRPHFPYRYCTLLHAITHATRARRRAGPHAPGIGAPRCHCPGRDNTHGEYVFSTGGDGFAAASGDPAVAFGMVYFAAGDPFDSEQAVFAFKLP
jgi:hypothetical protein